MSILLGAIGGAVGIGGTIAGAIGAGKERRRMETFLTQQGSENQAWYDQNYHQDYTQRADTQALIKNMRENLKRDNRRTESTAAITGATPEATNLVKENSNKVISDTYSRINAMGQAYKDGITDKYMTRKSMLAGQQMGMMEGRANSYENLMSNSLSGITDIATSLIAN